jgi:heptosyltransferase-2
MDLLTYWLYRGLGFGIGILPLGSGIRLGRMLGWFGYWLFGKYRRVAQRNIEIAFPDKAPHARRRLARQHFARLVGNLFAIEKLSRLSREKILKLVQVEGYDRLEQCLREKRGMVFVISHIGNWELLAQAVPLLFSVPTGVVFQRLSNPYMDAHVRETRSRIRLALFERKEGFNAACEMLRQGGIVGVLMDQHAGDAGVWCPLFGRLASTTPLTATLALRTGAALVPSAMFTQGIGRWRLVIEKPVELPSRDLNEGTARLNVALERLIRQQPEDWFWVHQRWKTPRPKFLLATYKRGVVVPPELSPRERTDAESGELFEFATRKQTWGVTSKLQPFRILIRSSNWLGDAVMTVPAVRAIKRGRPDAHVTVLTPGKLADVWKTVPEVDAVVPFEGPKGRGLLRTLRGLFHPWKVARSIKGRGFEAAVLFPNSIRTAVEAWLAEIPRRVGYPGHRGRGWFLDQIYREKKRKTKVAPPPEHQVYHYLKLAEFIGAAPSAMDLAMPSISTPASNLARIAVCPGAEYGPAKRWLPERYAEVIKAMSAERSCQWFLVGTAKDRPVAEEIAALAANPDRIENLCGRTTLTELINLLRSCDVLVTNDTGTMHLAALLGVRTVSIFGSTEPQLTGPLGSGHMVLRRQVECSPCFLRECPIDFRCMKAIESREVVSAVRKVLAGTPMES